MMMILHAKDKIKEEKDNTIGLQLKLSTIFKEKLNNIPQAYGSLFNRNGEYCALGAIVKYLGYDTAVQVQAASTSTSSTTTERADNIKNHNHEYENDNRTADIWPLYSSSSFELIPWNILEKIERFSHYSSNSITKHPMCCNRVLENHYDYSLISLLIHLNDYHRMSFADIGNWLESKGL
jgi:hypothetical protein